MSATSVIINATLLKHGGDSLREARYLRFESGRILADGPMCEWAETASETVIDAAGGLVMPGLVNGHNHCAMTLFRGLADDLPLHDWLHHHIFPAEAARVDPDMVYWCTKLAAAEMLLSGTTTVADGYFFSSEAARALDDAGMRAVVAHGIVDFPAPSVPDPADNISTAARFIKQWHRRSPRIVPAVFAHAPYTCSPRTLIAAKELATATGSRFFIHLAESREEASMIIDPRGDTPLRHLAELGILDSGTVCVHGIWLDHRDLELLAASGAGLVTCPQSNLKLASGICPVPEIRRRGIPVGIGTDGCASNNGLDLFREMGLMAKLYKGISGDPTVLSAREVLDSATRTGAALLGLDSCGSLEPGSRADLIILNLNAAHLTPFYNQDLLVYSGSGSDVDTVIVEGRTLVRHRRILSFELAEVMERVRELAR